MLSAQGIYHNHLGSPYNLHGIRSATNRRCFYHACPSRTFRSPFVYRPRCSLRTYFRRSSETSKQAPQAQEGRAKEAGRDGRAVWEEEEERQGGEGRGVEGVGEEWEGSDCCWKGCEGDGKGQEERNRRRRTGRQEAEAVNWFLFFWCISHLLVCIVRIHIF